MCIKLKRIETYTSEIVDFIKNHSDAYNGSENLIAGVNVDKDKILFNIIKDNTAVGFFMVVDVTNEVAFGGHEIEIGVFELYQGNNYAQYCLSNIKKLLTLDNIDISMISALVKTTNPDRDKIINTLIKSKFMKYDTFNGNELFCKKIK